MTEKIAVRIPNAQSRDKIEGSQPREVIVYHWHRIFGVLFIALVLLTGLIWGIRYVLRGPALPNLDSGRASIADEKESAAGADTQAGVATGKEEKASGSSIPPSTASLTPKVPTSAEQGGDSRAPETGQSGLALRSEPTGTGPVAETRAKPAIPSGSTSVKRVQLTSNIVHGEPVDNIGPIISMNEKGLIRVYLLMETSGLKGRTLFHDWVWNEKRIAHVRIPLRRNNQNAASSKFIDRAMMGCWLVKIVDEKNSVLGQVAFEVR